jgi:hypothetical protein
MGLAGIWIRTLGDGLIRADQVIGIGNHRTPALRGKPARWLLTVSLAVPAGSGNGESWDLSSLHRTLVQSDREARQAPEALARLLAQLAEIGAAGVVTPRVCGPDRDEVRFEFTRFGAEPAVEAAPTQADMVAVG